MNSFDGSDLIVEVGETGLARVRFPIPPIFERVLQNVAEVEEAKRGNSLIAFMKGSCVNCMVSAKAINKDPSLREVLVSRGITPVYAELNSQRRLYVSEEIRNPPSFQLWSGGELVDRLDETLYHIQDLSSWIRNAYDSFVKRRVAA